MNLPDAIAEAIAARVAELTTERVVERLRSMPGFGTPVYATAKNNPLGSERAFLNAHRDGKFPTFSRGRFVSAKWEDVERWMMSRQKPANPTSDVEADFAAEMAGKRRAKRTA